MSEVKSTDGGVHEDVHARRSVPLWQRAVRPAVAIGALWPLALVVKGAFDRPAAFAQNLVEGVSLGGIYALIALGYTMVYGVLGLINFAHSDVFMVGAYVGIFTAAAFGVTATSQHGSSVGVALACIVAAMAVCAVLAMVIERVAYRPLRDAPKLTPLVTAIGVSMFLQNAGILLFTATPRGFPAIVRSSPVTLGPVTVTSVKLLDLGVALVLMVALTVLVQRTRMGRAMRAISTNLEASRLMGINPDWVISFTFGLASALAGAGGILFGLDQPKIDPLTGVQPGLKAFVAAVLGGIGNIPGAVVGGLLIGLVEQLSAAYLSSSFAPAIVFSILVLVLLVKPQGILGSTNKEKV